MVTEEQEVTHRQGRGEMKYDVFRELEKLEKEILLERIPHLDKRRLRSFLTILKRRLEKL